MVQGRAGMLYRGEDGVVPDSALAACQILLHNTKKEQIFLSADVPPVRSPPVWPCEGLCGLLWEGAESPAPPGGYRPDLGRCPAVSEKCLFGACAAP